MGFFHHKYNEVHSICFPDCVLQSSVGFLLPFKEITRKKKMAWWLSVEKRAHCFSPVEVTCAAQNHLSVPGGATLTLQYVGVSVLLCNMLGCRYCCFASVLRGEVLVPGGVARK